MSPLHDKMLNKPGIEKKLQCEKDIYKESAGNLILNGEIKNFSPNQDQDKDIHTYNFYLIL